MSKQSLEIAVEDEVRRYINSLESDKLTLDFSANWNNKLFGRSYTTIRRPNADRYYKGNRLYVRRMNRRKKDGNIYLEPVERHLWHVATISDVKHVSGDQLNDWLCHLDTGYDVHATRGILMRMYKVSGDQLKTMRFAYLLLVKVSEEQLKQEALTRLTQTT